MPNPTITTSIVVNFNAGETSAIATAEIDARPDGLNHGKTEFLPGDDVGYLVFLSGAKITKQTATAGQIISAPGGLFSASESIQFANASDASTEHPITSGLTTLWKGLDGGQLIAAGRDQIRAVQGPIIGLAEVSYQSRYSGFILRGVPTKIDQVLIVLEAEELTP